MRDVLILIAMSWHSFTLNFEKLYKSWENDALHPNNLTFLIILSTFFCNLHTSLLNFPFSYSSHDSAYLTPFFLKSAYKKTLLQTVALMTSLAVVISTQNKLLF